MSAEHETVTLDGKVTDLFSHRFVLATDGGKILADLGPKGAEAVTLTVGDQITVSGKQKPSEIKVHSLVRDGRTFAVRTEEGGATDEAAAAAAAIDAVKAAGFEPVGEPKRKPKHFEVIGRRNDEFTEFHVGLGGDIRKSKPASSHKSKV